MPLDCLQNNMPFKRANIPRENYPEINTRYRQQLDNIGFGLDWSREFKPRTLPTTNGRSGYSIQLFDAWYDHNEGKSRHIDALVARFAAHGTEGLNAAQTEEMNFSAEEWAGMDEAAQSEVLLNYRLAYRSESNVNWCPALGTVLANDEVKDGLSELVDTPVVQKENDAMVDAYHRLRRSSA